MQRRRVMDEEREEEENSAIMFVINMMITKTKCLLPLRVVCFLAPTEAFSKGSSLEKDVAS